MKRLYDYAQTVWKQLVKILLNPFDDILYLILLWVINSLPSLIPCLVQWDFKGFLYIRLCVVMSAEGYEAVERLHDIIHLHLSTVDRAEPFVVMSLHHLFFIEMEVYDPDIVPEFAIPLRPSRIILEYSNVTREAVEEKPFGRHGPDYEEIIVEIYESV